jgi:transmembrane sensor
MINISPDILEKYLAGKCTPEERAIVDQWFKQFENDVEDSRLLNIQERGMLDAKMLHEIKNKIKAHTPLRSSDPLVVKRPLTKKLYKAVVGIAAALVMGLMVYYLSERQVDFQPSTITNIKISNTSEGITRHELTDGTMIWLRPKSHIEFPSEFLKDKRELKLAGEAFFDVAKDSARPFIITTGNVTTKVLGTSFNIKAYDEASSIEVAVLTGKVAVDIVETETKTSASSVLLTPNQRVTYVKERNTLEKEEAKTLPELSIWQATDVVFDNVPVKDVIKILDKKFDVRIQASNKNLLNCLIRADFTNQNLPDILELLSKSVEATYELKNDTIYLSGEGCMN